MPYQLTEHEMALVCHALAFTLGEMDGRLRAACVPEATELLERLRTEYENLS